MTDNHLAKFYSGPASILADQRILTAVSIFLQTTQQEIIDVFLLRQQSKHQSEDGQTIGQGYIHYPKREKKKFRYITEPLPQLRSIQETILFTLQGIEQRHSIMQEELEVYARLQGHNVDISHINNHQKGLQFNESPIQKTAIHRDARIDRPYTVEVDIANAYSSLSEEKLFFILQDLLKTQYNILPFKALSPLEIQKATALIGHFLAYDNHLATWAPTSPYIFHKALKATDEDIVDTLASTPIENPVYTRYLDDIYITFDRINTPTSSTITEFASSLYQIYDHLEDEWTIDVIPRLAKLLPKMQHFFTGAEVIISDNDAKRETRKQLVELRSLLIDFKNMLLHRPEHALEYSIQYVDGWLSEEYFIEYFEKTLTILNRLSNSLWKSLFTTIKALDWFKRKLDKTTPDYEITKESIQFDIEKILRKHGWPVNKSKIKTRWPSSPSMSTMLGLGINNSNKITIPSWEIKRKLEMYRNILTDKSPIPRHFKHKESGILDYWKILTSLQGYKEYILEIKWADKKISKKEKMQYMRHLDGIFTKEEAILIRRIEKKCASHFGISVEEAHELIFSARTVEKEQAYAMRKGRAYQDGDIIFDENGEPVDTRDIPRELADSNLPPFEELYNENWYDPTKIPWYIDESLAPIDEREIPWELLAEQKQDNNREVESEKHDNRPDNIDDLPF